MVKPVLFEKQSLLYIHLCCNGVLFTSYVYHIIIIIIIIYVLVQGILVVSSHHMTFHLFDLEEHMLQAIVAAMSIDSRAKLKATCKKAHALVDDRYLAGPVTPLSADAVPIEPIPDAVCATACDRVNALLEWTAWASVRWKTWSRVKGGGETRTVSQFLREYSYLLAGKVGASKTVAQYLQCDPHRGFIGVKLTDYHSNSSTRLHLHFNKDVDAVHCVSFHVGYWNTNIQVQALEAPSPPGSWPHVLRVTMQALSGLSGVKLDVQEARTVARQIQLVDRVLRGTASTRLEIVVGQAEKVSHLQRMLLDFICRLGVDVAVVPV